MQHIKKIRATFCVSRSLTYNLEDRVKVQSRDVRTEGVKKRRLKVTFAATIASNI